MTLDKKRWVNTKELEERYGIKYSTQGKLRMKREIPFHKIGRNVAYDCLEIDKWLESKKV